MKEFAGTKSKNAKQHHKTKKRRISRNPLKSQAQGGLLSRGGYSQGGQSCLAEEVGAPYTPMTSMGALSPPQPPSSQQMLAEHEDRESAIEGEPCGPSDIAFMRSNASTSLRGASKKETSQVPSSVTGVSVEHPPSGDSVQPALVALAAMASACLAISALAMLSRLLSPAQRPQRGACLTRACAALNDMLVAASNASVDPCDNFYEHVCGGWAESTSVYEHHLSNFVDKVIDVLVRASLNDQVWSPTKQAATLVQSCLAIVEDGKDETEAFKGTLSQLGVSWPRAYNKREDLTVQAAKVFEAFGMSPLLSIRRSRNLAGDVTLRIEPGDIVPKWIQMRSLLMKEGTYQSYYERTAALKENNTAPAMSFEEFRKLENTLLPALMSTDRSNAEILELNSIEQLKDYLEGDTFLHLQAFLRYELKLPPSTRVKMRAVPYIKRLLGLLNQLGLQRMEFYVGWCLLQAMWRFISKPFSEHWYSSVRSALHTLVERPSHADCIELAESLMGWTVYTEFARTHVDQQTLDDVDVILRAVTEPIVQQMKHGRWSFIADMVSPSQGDFDDVFFHNKRFGEQRLRSVFDTVAMNASLLHNWMALAGANAQIAEEEWRDVSSSYMRQLRESRGYELFDAQHVAVRIPPLFTMMPLYDRDYTVAAKYGAIGTLLGAAAVRLFVTRLPHTSAARTKILQKLDCFAPSRVSPPGSSPRVSRPAYLAAVVDLVWEAFVSADAQVSPAAADLLSYTSDVTFFVVLCHLLCSVRASLSGEFSCNQVAKNSRAFARVFKCEVGRPMNPLKKCDFFSYT